MLIVTLPILPYSRTDAQALKAAATSAQGLLSQAALTAPDAISSGNNSSSCIKRSYTGSAGNGGSGYNMGGGGESGNGSRRGRGSGRGDSTLAIAKELRNLCDASAKEALEQQAARMVRSVLVGYGGSGVLFALGYAKLPACTFMCAGDFKHLRLPGGEVNCPLKALAHTYWHTYTSTYVPAHLLPCEGAVHCPLGLLFIILTSDTKLAFLQLLIPLALVTSKHLHDRTAAAGLLACAAVMADPLAQLMASRGMPLGISIRHTASGESACVSGREGRGSECMNNWECCWCEFLVTLGQLEQLHWRLSGRDWSQHVRPMNASTCNTSSHAHTHARTHAASNYPSSVAAAADVLTASHVHSFSQHSLEAIKQVYRKAWGGLGEVPPNTNSASSSSSASDACSEGPY
eukprot:scaffold70508_cov23-Tisochrysis_lutea.AAC.1